MKKIKIIGIFVIFIISFISHYVYDLIPNFFTSILFPVNESIWEHMKLIATPLLIFAIFEYFYYKKKEIKCNNFLLSYSIGIILGIITYLIIYLPIDALIGHNIIISISLLFLIFVFIQYIVYKLMCYRPISNNKIIGILLVILIYVVFYYFTYYPSKNPIFYDKHNECYGIEKTSDK